MNEKTLTRNLLVKEKPTPVEKQIEFLKKVIFDQEEYEKLLDDVEGYCAKQKPPINLNMDVLEHIHNIIMYDVAIDSGFAKECGEEGAKSLESMKKTIQRMQRFVDGSEVWPPSKVIASSKAMVIPKVVFINCTMLDLMREIGNIKYVSKFKEDITQKITQDLLKSGISLK